MGHNPKTFADAVVLGAYEARDDKRPYLLADLANALPRAKRISYNSTMESFIERSKALSIDEIFGQFHKVVLPFRTLWIERQPSALELEESKGKGRSEIGFLVNADSTPGAFSFQTFASTKFEPGFNPTLNMDGAVFARQLFKRARAQGKLGTGTHDVEFAADRQMYCPADGLVHVNADGITFDDDRLMRSIEETQKKNRSPSFHPENIINALYNEAEFLLRTFTALSSRRVHAIDSLSRSPGDLEAEAYDKLRLKRGRVPLVPVTPITIDLSKAAAVTLDRGNPKEIRQLLGWTSVMAHPLRVNGVVYTRKEHERKIPADEDRRGAVRILTNSKEELRLVLENGQAARKIEPAH